MKLSIALFIELGLPSEKTGPFFTPDRLHEELSCREERRLVSKLVLMVHEALIEKDAVLLIGPLFAFDERSKEKEAEDYYPISQLIRLAEASHAIHTNLRPAFEGVSRLVFVKDTAGWKVNTKGLIDPLLYNYRRNLEEWLKIPVLE